MTKQDDDSKSYLHYLKSVKRDDLTHFPIVFYPSESSRRAAATRRDIYECSTINDFYTYETPVMNLTIGTTDCGWIRYPPLFLEE